MSTPDKLAAYRAKRSRERTPEPVPATAALPRGGDDTFVIQEHHARRLHWDLRLERGGVLVSWALPKGIPVDPRRDHLAVQTEDHPLEYASFEGEIPKGEYGAGAMTIWDRGTYETEKWRRDEVMVVLHGTRVSGRYVLFRTGDENWMIHRMDPPRAGFEPMPAELAPMLARPGTLPRLRDDEQYAYEMKWDGVRAIAYVEGGRVRLVSRGGRDITEGYPELRGLGPALGALACVLDGEIVAIDDQARPSFDLLQRRMHVRDRNQVRRLAKEVPVTYLLFDLLYLDGSITLDLPYERRRDLLEALGLSGPHWATPPSFVGNGSAALDTSRQQGLEGVIAKRLGSPYRPGRRGEEWIKVKHVRTQDVVIGGYQPGTGRREGGIGSLLLGVQGGDGLVFVGHVGTGFTAAMLDDLLAQLEPLRRQTSPFVNEVPAQHARDARWVSPRLVGEVVFADWTTQGRLRAASWRGLRPDKAPEDVVHEP